MLISVSQKKCFISTQNNKNKSLVTKNWNMLGIFINKILLKQCQVNDFERNRDQMCI